MKQFFEYQWVLKLLHNAYHNRSSLVIRFKSVKSILILFKSEAEFLLESLYKTIASNTGVLFFLSLRHVHFQPGEHDSHEQDFCQRVLLVRATLLFFSANAANQGFVCLLPSPGCREQNATTLKKTQTNQEGKIR